MGKGFWTPVAGIVVLALAGGCARYTDLNEGFSEMASRNVPERLKEIHGVYEVGPMDELGIAVQDNPSLNTRVTVRPDGCVTMSPLGDVYVEGKTPEGISEELSKLLESRIRDVETTVTVLAFNSKRVYVFGEVGTPGPQAFTGIVTLVDAIANARGVNRRSAPGRVRLVRGALENQKVFKINLKKIIKEGDANVNLMLQEGDIVYVPTNVFAKVGDAIDLVLLPFRGLLSAVFMGAQVQNLQ